MRKLELGFVKVLSPYTLPEEAFELADIVISDVSSGALTDAILVNKKVVCLARAEELQTLELPEIIPQIPICLMPKELPQKVEEAFTLDTGTEGFQKLRRYMFDTTEGCDAERAAIAIMQAIEKNQNSLWSKMRTGLRGRKEHFRSGAGRVKRYLLSRIN